METDAAETGVTKPLVEVLHSEQVYEEPGAGTVFRFGFTTKRRHELEGLGSAQEALSLRQVHGAKLERVRPHFEGLQADGWLFDRPGEDVAAIFVADCLPVALYAPEQGRAALTHCGHRGLSGLILHEAARELRAGASDSAPILAWLGPRIGACCYQVQADVADTFARSWPSALSPHPERGWFLDLCKVAALQLAELGAQLRGVLEDCTHCETGRYWSYRRGDRKTGRQCLLGQLRRLG